jgi:hypothetical protein
MARERLHVHAHTGMIRAGSLDGTDLNTPGVILKNFYFLLPPVLRQAEVGRRLALDVQSEVWQLAVPYGPDGD